MAATASVARLRPAHASLRFAPSLPDCFFAVLLAALFGQGGGWQALLNDGDTGWHIRTGEYILRTAAVPAHDLFSFSRPGQPWFAWEWLSDVILAKLFQWQGLTAVSGFAAVVVCLSASLLFCWLLRRGAGLWIALPVTLAAVSASSIHYLARPHLFSLLLLVPALWLLNEDRHTPTPRLWWLVPLAAVWTNLHAGFVAWLAILSVLVAVSAAAGDRTALRRYGLLTCLSTLATLLNPYGWRLHQHILHYVRSNWILEHVQEFQSPRIRSESMLIFALLLLAGLALAGARLARPGWLRPDWFENGLVLIWGLAALRSARHIPLFAIVVAPVIASHAGRWWARRAAEASARSPIRIWWNSGLDLAGSRGLTPWMPVLGALILLAAVPAAGMSDFPASRFPAAALSRNLDRFVEPASPHLLTTDQWADYLVFRLYPRIRVFFDGRSDFYGDAVGDDYQVLLGAGRRWPEVFARYGFDLALLPLDWPLGQILERDPHWQVVYRDAQAVLLARHSEAATP